MTHAPKTFVRDATGLVREVSPFAHLVTQMNGVLPLMSMALTPWWIWFAVPGGDPIPAMIIAYLCGIFGTMVAFAVITATFPRSASPYVATSRIIHPAIGWPIEALSWLSSGPFTATLGGVLLSWALVPGLYTMGVSSGNPNLIAAANALTLPVWSFVVETLVIVIFFIINVMGVRHVVRTYQFPLTVLMFIGVITVIVLWAGSSLAQVQAVVPKYLHTDYSSIISAAKNSYPNFMGPYTYSPAVIIMGLGFTGGAFNSYWNAWIVGEVKRANSMKMQYLSMAIPSTMILLCALGTLGFALSGVGRDFLIAMNQILTNNPSFFQNVPTSYIAGSSTMILVPMMLANNTMVQFLLMVGIAAACMIWPMASWLMIGRDFFAWSFDRLLPAKFADVSDRFHTPVFNLFVNFVIMEAFAVFLTYIPQYFGFAIAAEWAFAELPIMVYMIAVILMPLRKDIWALSPANKYKIGPVPIAVIGGIIGALFMADNVWFLSTTPAVGFGLQPAEIVFGVCLVPFVLYWVIRAIRKKQGIDIDLIFRSIPPE